MIDKNLYANNDLYVAPVCEELIKLGERLGVFNIPAGDDGMYELGILEDIEEFTENPLHKLAAADCGAK